MALRLTELVQFAREGNGGELSWFYGKLFWDLFMGKMPLQPSQFTTVARPIEFGVELCACRCGSDLAEPWMR